MPHYPFNYYTLHAACVLAVGGWRFTALQWWNGYCSEHGTARSLPTAERVPHIPGVEVLDIDILVRGCFALAPEQQTLFGRQFLHRDVLDGKPKDDCPDHPEGQLGRTVTDF